MTEDIWIRVVCPGFFFFFARRSICYHHHNFLDAKVSCQKAQLCSTFLSEIEREPLLSALSRAAAVQCIYNNREYSSVDGLGASQCRATHF